MSSVPVVVLRGARFHQITEAQCVQLVLAELAVGHGGWIITMNLDHLRRFRRDPVYAKYNGTARLVTADGMPLVWASRIQGTPLPERVTGSNLIWSLSKAAGAHGRSIFLIGGSGNSAQVAADILQKRFPGLRIAGVLGPFPSFQAGEADLAQLELAVSAAKPDIVFVALGCPKQEQLIERLQHALPKSWWLGVGGSFSVVSGEIPRAPIWMQDVGLEWFYRLSREPKRLAKRYLFEGLPFACTLIASAIRHQNSARN